MTENPYAAPDDTFEIEPSYLQEQFEIATRTKRFLNAFIDNFVVRVFAGCVGIFLGAIGAFPEPASESDLRPLFVGMLWGILVTMTYFVGMESLFQRTFGKFVTGTKVVNADGGAPSFKQILGRTLARAIPLEALSFLVGHRPIGWHDSLSGTRVINTR